MTVEYVDCHSNESSQTLTIKFINFMESNVISMYAKFQLHLPYGFREEDFLIFFFENLRFISPRQPIKLSDLDKSRMKRGGLLNKHFCKKIKYPQ